MRTTFNWIVISLLLIVTAVASGCVGQVIDPDGITKERYFIEGYFTLNNTVLEDRDPSTNKYGLITGQETEIVFTATKYMRNVTGRMLMNVSLPDGIEFVGGEREWIGNDISKTLTINVKTSKRGRWIVSAYVINLDNGFSSKYEVLIYVNDTIDDIRGMGFLGDTSTSGGQTVTRS